MSATKSKLSDGQRDEMVELLYDLQPIVAAPVFPFATAITKSPELTQ